MTVAPAKAILTAYEPPKTPGAMPGGKIGSPVTFQFNPHTLAMSKGARWLQNPAAKSPEVGTPEFQGAEPRRLNVELFLDATATHDDSVARAVDTVLGWCTPTEASIAAKAPCPPRVVFTWGTFQAVTFAGYLESVNATFTLFDTDGKPLRATCTVALAESGEPTPGQNPTSGALTARRVHRLVGGDSLEMLAYQEYGDATAWRRIAEANDIDDPMRLRPGTEVLVPSGTERRAGAA